MLGTLLEGVEGEQGWGRVGKAVGRAGILISVRYLWIWFCFLDVVR